MSTIAQELVLLQAEFQALVDAWNGMSAAERSASWNAYLDALDEGGDGWHRFSRVLLSAWCEGWCPLAGIDRSSDGELMPALLQAA